MKGVGARFGDCIDGAARKAALFNVKRCYAHLDLVECLDGNRLCACLSAVGAVGGETKYIVVHCAVHLECVVAVVDTCKRHCAVVGGGDERIEPCSIGDGVRHRGHILDVLSLHAARRSGFRCVKFVFGDYDNLLQFLCLVAERGVEFEGFAE